mmetsp:Transcript_17011/g.48448  ORF Transcript_17011/g.48448 Transcript_17011/m.48448 type:complete len:205 (-) Transcript_17011:155-769(-)
MAALRALVAWPLVALTSGLLREHEETACNARERSLLKKMDAVADRIHGRLGGQETVLPGSPPGECRAASASPLRGAMECYEAWGFSKEVASCWAVEETKKKTDCGSACVTKGTFVDSAECLTCMAGGRADRRRCVYQTVGIGEACQACDLAARRYWDTHCVVLCKDLLNPDPKRRYSYGQELSVAPICRACTRKVDADLAACGL